jgi:hypothetical protein
VWQTIQLNYELLPLGKKNFDVSFVGQVDNETRKHRKQQCARLEKVCKKLGLRAKIHYPRILPNKFGEIIRHSKLSYSFKGLGHRCRREWEVLLTGACLVLDQKLKDDGVPVCDFEPGEHFLWNDEDNLADFLKRTLKDKERLASISQAGYDLAQECFVQNRLSLDERYFRAYLLDQDAHIRSYRDLLDIEERLGLEK